MDTQPFRWESLRARVLLTFRFPPHRAPEVLCGSLSRCSYLGRHGRLRLSVDRLYMFDEGAVHPFHPPQQQIIVSARTATTFLSGGHILWTDADTVSLHLIDAGRKQRRPWNDHIRSIAEIQPGTGLWTDREFTWVIARELKEGRSLCVRHGRVTRISSDQDTRILEPDNLKEWNDGTWIPVRLEAPIALHHITCWALGDLVVGHGVLILHRPGEHLA